MHGRVVDSSAVLAGQRLDLLLQLLGVETVVHAPGVAGDGSPRVVRQTRVPVVLHVGLGRHVLHLLKVQKSVEENYNSFDEMIKLQYIWLYKYKENLTCYILIVQLIISTHELRCL